MGKGTMRAVMVTRRATERGWGGISASRGKHGSIDELFLSYADDDDVTRCMVADVNADGVVTIQRDEIFPDRIATAVFPDAERKRVLRLDNHGDWTVHDVLFRDVCKFPCKHRL